MTSFLRKVVAGPRAPHAEANLDLCYVTDNIIATSGPSSTFPSSTYRNPLPQLVRFLDSKHGTNWAIWEFRAEGTGYPDSDVYGRIWHFPWPDHHPPPFGIVPGIMASMRDWLRGEDIKQDQGIQNGSEEKDRGRAREVEEQENVRKKRVIVVHCKAGKGRSGSMAVSYLLSEEGWDREKALQRFTERRMRPGFGAGVSIPSQLRWLDYVERWATSGKVYVERMVEVLEVHVWGLRDGVKISVEGYEDGGKRIKTCHVFEDQERDDNASGNEHGQEKAEGVANSETENETTSTKQTSAPANRFQNVVREALHRKRAGDRSSTSTASRDTSTSRQSQSSTRATPTSSNKPSNTSNSSLPTPATKISSVDTNRSSTTKSSFSTLPHASSNQILISTRISTTTSPQAGPASTKTAKPQPQPQPSSLPTSTKTNTVFRPRQPIPIPTSDINLSVRRRAHASYGITMVTSIAHVWFNCYFEGSGPENRRKQKGPDESGVYTVEWDAMDGLKGSSKKGARAFDKVAVVWRAKDSTSSATKATGQESDDAENDAAPDVSAEQHGLVKVITQPAPGEEVKGGSPARSDATRHEDSYYEGEKELEIENDEDGAEGIRRGVQEM